MTELQALIERKFLPFVEKPLRYAGGEPGTVKKDLSRVTVHGVLCFPDLYDIGMSHLGMQLLYHIVNSEPAWALSRCFCPWGDAEALMRRLPIPLYSIEYFTPLCEADWLGFSVQYELHYTNVLTMLDLAGISVFRSGRRETDPLVIAGGPCVGNPEPLAEFVDAFAIGDGEDTVRSICRTIERLKGMNASRSEKLTELSRLRGVYVPSLHPVEKRGRFSVPAGGEMPKVKAAKLPALASGNYPGRPLVPLMDVVHHRLGVEILRGCTRGCRFCSAGTYYRPVRERDPAELYKEIENGIAATGWRDVGLLSLSSADYSCMSTLLAEALALKRRCRVMISLPSTRIDALTPEQFDSFVAVSPVSSLTLAPEAGSARLRRVINKDFPDEAVFAAVKILLDRGVQTIKLYFMIGLPTECADDIEAVIGLVGGISRMASSVSHRRNVNVSVSPFSPKPHTPFQWEAMESAETLDEKSRYIKKSLRRFNNVKVSYRDARSALVETASARGDRAFSAVIYNAWKRGARFDGWDETFDFERWTAAALEAGVSFDTYVTAIPPGAELPWQAVSTGVSEAFLLRERERSRAGILTPDCRGGACGSCGTCDTEVKPDIRAPAVRAAPAQDPATPPRTAPQSSIRSPLYYYRCMYSKGPSVRFLGHLDMVSVFHRALVGSGFDLAYSQGYNPHPRLSFGPPLPMGATGQVESFDVAVVKPLGGDPLRINGMLPPGLRALSFVPIRGGPSLTASIVAVRYSFMPYESIDATEIERAITLALGRTAIPLTVTKDGKERVKDLRPLIATLRPIPDAAPPSFEAVLSLRPGATCKPAELVTVLFPGRSAADFLICREECLVEKAGAIAKLGETEMSFGRRT